MPFIVTVKNNLKLNFLGTKGDIIINVSSPQPSVFFIIQAK